MAVRFLDRRDAGRQLAKKLAGYTDDPSVLVLGLPRGGVPVAYEVAHALHAPLDVFVVRKLGVPGHRELAMGAIASGGVRVLNPDVIDGLRISSSAVESASDRELVELERQQRIYRGQPARISVAVPVAAAETARNLGEVADEVVCLSAPSDFHAVSVWYEDFSQTTDEEVRGLLESASEATGGCHGELSRRPSN
jgi:putative phosphoribosyl transferase